MTEEQKMLACSLYRKRARKILFGFLVETVLITALLEFLVVFLGKNSEPELLVFIGVLSVIALTAIRIRDIVYMVKLFSAAAYISKNDMKMLLAAPSGFYKSMAQRLLSRYNITPDMARFTLDGKEHKAMIRNMLRLDKGSRQLLVFRGGRVFAVPAVFMKELAKQAKQREI